MEQVLYPTPFTPRGNLLRDPLALLILHKYKPLQCPQIISSMDGWFFRRSYVTEDIWCVIGDLKGMMVVVMVKELKRGDLT